MEDFCFESLEKKIYKQLSLLSLLKRYYGCKKVYGFCPSQVRNIVVKPDGTSILTVNGFENNIKVPFNFHEYMGVKREKTIDKQDEIH